jgi:hypothetical protein
MRVRQGGASLLASRLVRSLAPSGAKLFPRPGLIIKDTMNDPFENNLRDAAWRRKLTPVEEAELRAWVAAHPGSAPDWADEQALTGLLARLPEAPVSSNFTARVLQAIDVDAANARRAARRWSWRWFVPKAALASLLVGIGLFSYHSNAVARRTAVAKSAAAVSEVASLPSPEILQDFEAVRQLSAAPSPDDELLALMK